MCNLTVYVPHADIQSYENKQLEYDNLADSYDLLNQNSQTIIKTVQAERDEKIFEIENLKTQVSSVTTNYGSE